MCNNFNKFVLYSLIAHAVFIMVFSIKWYTNIRHSTKAIDITIVNSKSDKTPHKADFMAQHSNLGGGNSDTVNNPAMENLAKFPDEKLQQAETKVEEKIVLKNLDKKLNKQESTIIAKSNSKEQAARAPKINDSTSTEQNDVNFIVQTETVPVISSLLRNIEQREKLIARRPKTRYISASTQEYRDALYLDSWRKKIEYYGNKFYPEQAKTRNLSGEVLMLVAIKANGQIAKIKIEKSSGIKILDEAAVQTVHLAAPFEPFSAEMRKDTDILEVIRTWRFNKDKLETVTKSNS